MQASPLTQFGDSFGPEESTTGGLPECTPKLFLKVLLEVLLTRKVHLKVLVRVLLAKRAFERNCNSSSAEKSGFESTSESAQGLGGDTRLWSLEFEVLDWELQVVELGSP